MTRAGGIDEHWDPAEEPERPSCALDVAESGGLSEADVGVLLGVSKERIRQIETVALRKIRRPMARLAAE